MKVAECHPDRKHQARGLCSACYEKWLKKYSPKYKARHAKADLAWKRNNPDKVREIARRSRMKLKYGLQEDAYERLYNVSKGKCFICDRKPKRKRRLNIDHCHKTGQVRGLLCDGCNLTLGKIESGSVILENIIKYLKHWQTYLENRRWQQVVQILSP